MPYTPDLLGRDPGWDHVLLITTLKRGSIYVLPLTADHQKAAGHMWRYFQSENRYRDTAVSPDGKTIYVATDPDGLAESRTGGVTTNMLDKGAILAFTYVSETGGDTGAAPTGPETSASASIDRAAGDPPQFTRQQAAEGKKAYESRCAVCHGSTLTNGTFGTPLGGPYFQEKWSGRTVAALFEKSQKTMPPAAPGSLAPGMYANILAYVLEVNGHTAGGVALPAGGAALEKMRIK